MDKFYYRNLFIYSSLQFTGNFEEYFAKHTEKLVAFILMPRIQYKENLIRLYKKGKLVEEKKVTLSQNIFIYYFLWYVYQVWFVYKYFSRREKVILLSFFPNSFFAGTLQKFILDMEFVYWIADYFPPVSAGLRYYEKVKNYYNKNIKHVYYLSDILNKKYNGKVINSPTRRTVMWGVLPKNLVREIPKATLTLLFVGVIKKSQGLEFLFEFLKDHKNYNVKIIGIGDKNLYENYKKLIKGYKIENQVYFPNKFFLDSELEKISKSCHVGVAFYDIDKTSATYYTDPGKIKAYAQLGLPILMSNTSSIAPFVKRFKCGEVINKNETELENALSKIHNNYGEYLKGIKDFNKYFSYEIYYKKAFKSLEI